MEKVDNTNLITDFKSLEDESLTLLGLDIDDALENAKVYGLKIRKRNVLIQSVIAAVILLLVIGSATFLTIEARDKNTNAVATLRNFEPKTLSPVEPQTPAVAVETAPVAQAPQEVAALFVYPSYEVGNFALCTAPAPNETDGIMIGSASQALTYVPSRDGNSFPVEGTPGLKNLTSPTGEKYLAFGEGKYSNDNYRKQTATSMTYCDSSRRVDVTKDGAQYRIGTEAY